MLKRRYLHLQLRYFRVNVMLVDDAVQASHAGKWGSHKERELLLFLFFDSQ